MIGGMILTGEDRSTMKGNKTHINPAWKCKFLQIILLTKKRKKNFEKKSRFFL
jgi:hypothetical protein